MNYKTDQELFWATEFGNKYISRNQNWIINVPFFSKVINRTTGLKSVIEFGCNIGLNLKALDLLLPEVRLTGVEINKNACNYLERTGEVSVINSSIFDYDEGKKTYDMSMIKCVLIHINPTMLSDVYEKLYKSSNRYILISEYYNPSPVEVNYRGHNSRLFKRDFAGEMMDKYDNSILLDYGFLYHRDNNFQQDDINWFLLEKKIKE